MIRERHISIQHMEELYNNESPSMSSLPLIVLLQMLDEPLLRMLSVKPD